MAGMMGKLGKFARSSQGQKLADKAKKAANDPSTKRKIDDARQRLSKKR